MTNSDFVQIALTGFSLGYFLGFLCWAIRKIWFAIMATFTPPGM